MRSPILPMPQEMASQAESSPPGVTGVASAEADVADAPEKIPVKVLILPKFSVGDVTGTLSGEAYYYYYHYLDGAPSYTVPGAAGDGRLFIRDGVALSLLGMGKVNAALSTMAILSDSRFDFSDAYILSIGCAGSALQNPVQPGWISAPAP